jgi:hypothetical protein
VLFLVERNAAILLKAHIDAYTKKNGTFVPAHEDKRVKQNKPNIVKQNNEIADTITINGKQRSTKNSEGKLIHPTEEGIRNFYKWFGDSKVVDNKGNPLVVYHGSKEIKDGFKIHDGRVIFEPSFNEFNPNGKSEKGIYFTPNIKTAENYGFPIEFYLNSLSLKRNEDTLKEKPTDADAIYRMRASDNNLINAYEIAVFHPNQIKSATGNNGEFSKNNNEIYKSLN